LPPIGYCCGGLSGFGRGGCGPPGWFFAGSVSCSVFGSGIGWGWRGDTGLGSFLGIVAIAWPPVVRPALDNSALIYPFLARVPDRAGLWLVVPPRQTGGDHGRWNLVLDLIRHHADLRTLGHEPVATSGHTLGTVWRLVSFVHPDRHSRLGSVRPADSIGTAVGPITGRRSPFRRCRRRPILRCQRDKKKPACVTAGVKTVLRCTIVLASVCWPPDPTEAP